jgi:hypothetical protein
MNPSSAFFAWRYFHPHESEDPQAVWGAAWRAGGRAALNDSTRLVELMPLLRELLASLEDCHIECELRSAHKYELEHELDALSEWPKERW